MSESDKPLFKKFFKINLFSKPVHQCTKNELLEMKRDITNGMSKLLDECDLQKREISTDEETAYNIATDVLCNVEKELDIRAKSGDMGPRYSGLLFEATYGPDGKIVEPAKMRGGVNLSWRSLFYGNEKAQISDTRYVESSFRECTEKGTMLQGVGAQGGYFLPETFIAQTYDSTLALLELLSRVNVIPVTRGNSATIGQFDNADRSNGQHWAGCVVQWRAENESFTEVSPKTTSRSHALHKMGIFTSVSRELLEGCGGEFAPVLRQGFSYSLNSEGEHVILSGNGVGQPLGIFNADCTIESARTKGGEVGFIDLADMLGRLIPVLHSGAIWNANQEALPQLMQLQDPAGGYVWIANAGAPADSRLPGFLFVKSLLISDECMPLGQAGDIVLGNFSLYSLALKNEVSFKATNANRWLEDAWSYRSIWRIDGAPALKEPITPANGTNTVSAFVVLGE